MGKIGRWAALAAALSLSVGTSVYAESAPCYVLCEWNGKIALLIEGNDEPVAVYQTPLDSLYPADVELLKEGIRLKTRTEVSRLIEDLDLE